MNETTNSVAGSITRHTMTGVGAVGIAAAQDDILRVLSLIVTVIGLIWSIWEKIRRPVAATPPSPFPVAATPPSPLPPSGGTAGNNLWIFAAGLAALGFCSCATLDKSGVYAGDDALYAADLSITTSYDLIHTYVAWEKSNRAALAKFPEIKSSADVMRRDAKRWFATAHALRAAYAASPTPENRDALATALSVLRTALAEAAAYMAQAAGAP